MIDKLRELMRTVGLIAFATVALALPAFAQQNGSDANYRYQSNPDFRPGNTARMAQESVHRRQALRGEEQREWVNGINLGCGSDPNCRYPALR